MNEILIISTGLVVIILIVFTYFLYRLWKRCAKLKNNLIEFKEKYENFSQTNSQTASVKSISQKLTKYSLDEKEINIIADVVVPRVLECVKLELKESGNQSNVSNNLEKSNQDVKYFRSKQGKTLQEEVSNESEGVFKVFKIKGGEAKFEYCGGVQNPDWFGEIVEFTNNPQEVPIKAKIITTTPGVAKKGNNGIWEVTTPAKIKFI